MIPGVISLHVCDNQPSVLIMSMYHNRPGHVYSLGEPFVVPLNRRRPACYDTRSYATTERPMIQQPTKRAAARRGVGTSIYPRLSHSRDDERPMQQCNNRTTDDATTDKEGSGKERSGDLHLPETDAEEENTDSLGNHKMMTATTMMMMTLTTTCNYGATAAMMLGPMKWTVARRDYVSLIAIVITNHSNY